MKINKILLQIDDKILKRGKEYYNDNMISALTKDENNEFSALVKGSGREKYKVNVKISKDGDILDCSCNCPYDFSDVCKHLVAVFLAIKSDDFDMKKYKKEKYNDSFAEGMALAEILSSTNKNELIDYLLDMSIKDSRIEHELMFLFGSPDRDSEHKFIKDSIKEIIRKNSYRGFADYRGCNNICSEFYDLLDKLEKKFLSKSCLIVFDAALEVLLTCVKLASNSDSSSGMLTAAIDRSIRLLEKACFLISGNYGEKEQEECFCILLKQSKNKVFEGWGEWNYILLRFSVMFLTVKNRAKLEKALDELYRLYGQEKYSAYNETDDMLVRYSAIKKLDEQDKADEYLLGNLHIDEFCEIAIKCFMEKSSFGDAERLCLEKIEGVGSVPLYDYRADKWWRILYGIYEKTGEADKKIKVMKYLLLRGDISFYDELKSFYQERNRWEFEYKLLLSELKKSGLYEQILEQEQEWQLLLDCVKNRPADVFRYGYDLVKHYPEEIFAIYISEIEKAAADAKDRRMYKSVCSLMKEFAKAGGSFSVFGLIKKFAQQYKRRPSMLEELENLRKKLVKLGFDTN